MNTPENTTTTIDGKPASPDSTGTPTDQPMPADAGTETPASAEDSMAALQSEVARLRDQVLRDRADLENTRKRLQREKEEAVRYANSNLLEKLLPVIDNFELGLMAARQSPDTSSVISGMSMVQKQLENFLSENGMQSIDATGQKFDPNQHDALGEEPSAEVPEGHILRQQRKGYKLRDRLLRPASVFVSKGAA